MSEEMVRCSCGLIVASSKLKLHQESEHLVKLVSNYEEAKSK